MPEALLDQLKPAPAALKRDPRIISPRHPKWAYWVEQLKKTKVFAIDTETYGDSGEFEDALNPWNNKVRLLQVGVTNEPESKSVPNDAACLMLDFQDEFHMEVWEEFAPILKACVENNTQFVLGQNLSFDLMIYRVKWGWKARKTMDTMIMSNMLWAGIREYKHGLGAIAARCGITVDKTQQRSDWGAKDLSLGQLNYAALDVLALFPIAKSMWEWVEEAGATESVMIENYFVAALVDMEFNGMPVNTEVLSELDSLYTEIGDDLLKPTLEAWASMGGVEMSIPGLSVEREPFEPTQPSHFLQLIEHVTGDKLTETNKATLAIYEDKEPIRNVQLWRTLKTQVDYLGNLQKGLREGEFGPIVSGGFRQFAGVYSADGGAGTGRTASGQKKPFHCPNLQNASDASKYPKALKSRGMRSPRDSFIAPAGRKMLISDLSAAHARIATELSQDERLIAGYVDNVDNHVVVAKTLADLKGLDWSAMPDRPIKDEFDYKSLPEGKPLRSLAKNAFYGWLNAGGAATLQRTCANAGIEIEIEEAEATLEGLRTTYKDLHKYMKQLHVDAKQTLNQVKIKNTTYARLQPSVGGRICYSKCWPNQYRDNQLEPKISDCTAKTWLGIEANAIKHASVMAYYASIDNPEWELRMGAIVHDELDGTVAEAHAEAAAAMLLKVTDDGLARYVKAIPVNDNTDPLALIANCWAEK